MTETHLRDTKGVQDAHTLKLCVWQAGAFVIKALRVNLSSLVGSYDSHCSHIV